MFSCYLSNVLKQRTRGFKGNGRTTKREEKRTSSILHLLQRVLYEDGACRRLLPNRCEKYWSPLCVACALLSSVHSIFILVFDWLVNLSAICLKIRRHTSSWWSNFSDSQSKFRVFYHSLRDRSLGLPAVCSSDLVHTLAPVRRRSLSGSTVALQCRCPWSRADKQYPAASLLFPPNSNLMFVCHAHWLYSVAMCCHCSSGIL